VNHSLASDDRYRDSIHDEGDWSHRINNRDSPGNYRFGRTHGRPVWGSARATLNRFNGCLKNMIEAIADSKLRRMQHELELGGIRRGRLNGKPVAIEPGPAEPSRGAN
jgi:hypothetical protein